MNGIFVEDQDGTFISLAKDVEKSIKANDINVKIDGCQRWLTAAEYATESARDRAWAMLENAIASGVRLFRFPTDAEVEGEEE